MKKKLIALAAAAGTGLACAQSSVTLFGTVDLGVTSQTTTATDPQTGTSVKTRRTSLASSGSSSSYIGFRGTEDLGGGLAASFWLEAAVNADDGTAGAGSQSSASSLLFNRRSTVSLSGHFGELRLGRDYTPTYWSDTLFDPFGTTGSGASVISTVSGNTTLANSNYMRASNSVSYFLPSNLGGFYGQLQYAMPENTSTSTTTGSSTTTTTGQAGRYAGGRFGYAQGPLDVALSYGESVTDDTSELRRQVRTLNLGSSYDFGPVKLFGELSQVRNQFDYATLSRHDNYNGYLFGATVPVGAGLIRAAYSAVHYDEGGDGIYGSAPRAQKLSLGYVHNLSKRTSLYATIARVVNHNDSAYSGSLISASTTGFGDASYASGYTPRSSTGYDFGIRHSF
ncbi:MAG: porin [Xenophilus sp.]